MAISWGGWEYSGGNGMRVGLDVSWESITHGETVATCTIKVYTENQYSYNDDQKLSFGGAIGGSDSFHNGAGGSSVLRTIKTYNYDYGPNSYGSSPGTRTFSASLSGAFNGVTPSKSVTSNIPARPTASPSSPSNVQGARINDGSQKITWNNNSTSGEPWDRVRVQRDQNNDDTYVTVGTPGGGSTSFTDSGTVPNALYDYRIRAENSKGDSSYVDVPGVLFTTPAAPTGASRSGGGTSQTVSWSNQAGYSDYETEVWRSVNGAWALLTTKASGTTSHADTISASDKVKYRVRHKTTIGQQPTLYSDWSGETSETPGVTTPPDAPTGLAPNGVPVDPSLKQRLAWTYHSTDTSAQTKYEVAHRLAGTTDWVSTGQVSSSNTFYELPASTYADGDIVEWHARTWGSDPVPSEWAAPVSFQMALTPIPSDPIKLPVQMDLFTGQLEASTTAYLIRDLVMRFQSNTLGGGVRSVDSSWNISWSTRFIPISLGNGPTTFRRGYHNIDNPYGWTLTSRARASNVVTLTMNVSSKTQRMRVGEKIKVISSGDATMDGEWIVRSVTTNTVTYDCPGSNVSSTSSSGTIFPILTGHGMANQYPNGGKVPLPTTWTALYYEIPFGWGSGDTPRKNGVVSVTAKAIVSNKATLTVPAPHYFTVGDAIDVEIGDGVFDGAFTITEVTQTTVSYAKTSPNTSGAVTNGLVKPSGRDTFFGNFHLVYYSSGFEIPSTWVLLALRNADSSTVEWANGDTVDAGSASDSPNFKQAVFTSTTDASSSPGNKPPLRVGDPAGNHLRIDGNEIVSMDSDSATGSMYINKDGGGVYLGLGGGGKVYCRPDLVVDQTFSPLANVEVTGVPTTSAGANCNINTGTNNRLRLVTSSRRFKENIRDLDLDVSEALKLRPRVFQRNDEQDVDGSPLPVDEGSPWYAGFIAEEALDLGFEGWVSRNEDDEVTGFDYMTWVVALQSICQRQQATLAQMENRLAALEAQLNQKESP